MIKILENLSRKVEYIDSLSTEEKTKSILSEIDINLDDNIQPIAVDETSYPYEISVTYGYETTPGNFEYIGTFDIDMNEDETIKNYSNYLTDVAYEINAAASDYLL